MTLPPIALFAHEAWEVSEPSQLPPIGFYLDTYEFTEDTKANIHAEMVRMVEGGESIEKATASISREITRQIDDCLSRMNRMLQTGSYEETP